MKRRVERLLERYGVALPDAHVEALTDDLQGVREEGFPFVEDAWRELLRRIGGKKNLLRYTNTLVPSELREAA